MELRRSILSAFAALVAAAVPSLVSSPALADKPEGNKADSVAVEKDGKAAKAKHGDKHAAKKGKAHAAKDEKGTHAKAPLSKPKADASPDLGKQTKAPAAAAKGKKAKKTASRTAGATRKKGAKKADKEAPGRPCPSSQVTIDRGGLEAQTLPLLDCHDRPLESADRALSVLARPWGAPKPASLARGTHAPLSKHAGPDPRLAVGEVAPGVRLVDKGLLTRLDAISKRFPHRNISLVSGYRPQSNGSLHQHARALDLRVAGVSNEELVAFCKTLADTGCGYYPNSSFVHVDVRKPGTGTVSWIDASGPGEAPHYVQKWPPSPEDADHAVLPPEREPFDSTVDPWALSADSADDEHAPHPAKDGAGPTNDLPEGSPLPK
jgi:hypothetical protein